MSVLKIALLTTDNREAFRHYERTEPYFGTAPDALLQGFAHFGDCEIHVVACTQRPVGAPAKLAANVFFRSVLVPKFGWLRTGYQGCILATRRKLRELQPDIVHGQGTERDCAISAVFSGFPNVLTIHGNMRLIARINGSKPWSFNGLAARLEAFTLPRTDGVVCITRYTEDAVRSLARRTWVLPNAVDETFFDIHPAPDAMPLLICVGNICLRKNQNAFIRALDAVAAHQSFRIAFLGEVPDDAYGREFRSLVAERSWCEAAGFVDRAGLRTWFGRATALALPSLEDNCPMVVLEAMAAGVPVLAANVGGVPDLVEDGRTGLYCDPLDASSMAHGVERLLASPDLRARLSGDARNQALVRFHPKAVAQRHLEIYREVLGSSPSNRA